MRRHGWAPETSAGKRSEADVTQTAKVNVSNMRAKILGCRISRLVVVSRSGVVEVEHCLDAQSHLINTNDEVVTTAEPNVDALIRGQCRCLSSTRLSTILLDVSASLGPKLYTLTYPRPHTTHFGLHGFHESTPCVYLALRADGSRATLCCLTLR